MCNVEKQLELNMECFFHAAEDGPVNLVWASTDQVFENIMTKSMSP